MRYGAVGIGGHEQGRGMIDDDGFGTFLSAARARILSD
jgi:hypothetical protein